MAQNSHVCPWWLAYTFDNPLRKLFHNPARLFSPYLRPGMTAADIGCGMGYFSLGLARLVQPGGKVMAIDMQPQMLSRVDRRAHAAGLSAWIETHLTDGSRITGAESVDFALAFWMVHEVPDRKAFFSQVRDLLKPAGAFLMAEPKLHIASAQFETELQEAQTAGLQVAGRPQVAFSRAALLRAI